MGEKKGGQYGVCLPLLHHHRSEILFQLCEFLLFLLPHTHFLSLSLSVSSIQKQSLVKTLRVLFMPTHVKHS